MLMFTLEIVTAGRDSRDAKSLSYAYMSYIGPCVHKQLQIKMSKCLASPYTLEVKGDSQSLAHCTA